MSTEALVYYKTYTYKGKGKARRVSLSQGLIVGENSIKYKIKDFYTGKAVWRIKDNVKFA